jgi:hypothetical protein
MVGKRLVTYSQPSASAQQRVGGVAQTAALIDTRFLLPLVILTTLVLIAAFIVVIPPSEWGASAIYLSVISVGVFLLYLVSIKPIDPAFPGSLFVLAYLVKLLTCVGRYWMVFDLYDGAADAPLYHEHGQILAQYFKFFDFSVIQTYSVRGDGTTMLAHVTGFLYTIMPPSMAGAFFFFSALAFTGTVLCYCAARVAWPESNLRYYALCVFFLPSILFWPASLGKDAWILCWSGLAVWGWVSFIRRQQLLGLLWIAIALLMVQLVRPHIAAFLALSIGAAFFLYSTRGQRSLVTWLAGGVVVVLLGYYMVQGGADFLELEELSTDSLQARIEEQQRRTTQGGSSYDAVSILTPSGFVTGLITSAVRPFPWEANSVQMLITSLETMGWLVFCWLQRRAFWRKLRTIRGDPVAAFALCYTVAMLLALTSLGNFGIVARQRVMALPFLWMLFV